MMFRALGNLRRRAALVLCPELAEAVMADQTVLMFRSSRARPASYKEAFPDAAPAIPTEPNPHQHLIDLCLAYASHKNVTHWRVSLLARGDGQYFKRLMDGKGSTVRVSDAVMRWFSDNWPADLEWPSDIPRPKPSGKEAA